MNDPALSSATTTSLISVFTEERDGHVVDRRCVSAVLSLLATLSSTCFASLFMVPFVEASQVYFRHEALRMTDAGTSRHDTPSTYLRHIKRRLVEESDRATMAAGASANDSRDLKASLLRVVETEMIESHTQYLLEGLPAFVEAFSSNRRGILESTQHGVEVETDLSRLYATLSRVRLLESLSLAWYQYVEVSYLAGLIWHNSYH